MVKKCNLIERLRCPCSSTVLFMQSHALSSPTGVVEKSGDQYQVSQAQQWGSCQVAFNCCFLFMCNMLTALNELFPLQ